MSSQRAEILPPAANSMRVIMGGDKQPSTYLSDVEPKIITHGLYEAYLSQHERFKERLRPILFKKLHKKIELTGVIDFQEIRITAGILNYPVQAIDEAVADLLSEMDTTASTLVITSAKHLTMVIPESIEFIEVKECTGIEIRTPSEFIFSFQCEKSTDISLDAENIDTIELDHVRQATFSEMKTSEEEVSIVDSGAIFFPELEKANNFYIKKSSSIRAPKLKGIRDLEISNGTVIDLSSLEVAGKFRLAGSYVKDINVPVLNKVHTLHTTEKLRHEYLPKEVGMNQWFNV